MVTSFSPLPHLSLPPPILSCQTNCLLANSSATAEQHFLFDSDSETHSSLSSQSDNMEEQFQQQQQQSTKYRKSKNNNNHSSNNNSSRQMIAQAAPTYYIQAGYPTQSQSWISPQLSYYHHPNTNNTAHDVHTTLSPSLSAFSAPHYHRTNTPQSSSQSNNSNFQYNQKNNQNQNSSKLLSPIKVQASYPTTKFQSSTNVLTSPQQQSFNNNSNHLQIDTNVSTSFISSPSIHSVNSTPTEKKSKANKNKRNNNNSSTKPKLRESSSQPNLLRAHRDSVSSLTSSCSSESIDQLDDPDAVFICPHCPRKFTRNSNLTRHKRIHTGIKRFECDECNKNFMERHHLVAHKRTHTGEKPFGCPQCSRTFTDRSNRNRHIRTHGISPPPSPVITPETATENNMIMNSNINNNNINNGNNNKSKKYESVPHQDNHIYINNNNNNNNDNNSINFNNNNINNARSSPRIIYIKNEPSSPALTYHLPQFSHSHQNVVPALIAVPTPIPAAIPYQSSQSSSLAIPAMSPLQAPRTAEIPTDPSGRKSSIEIYHSNNNHLHQSVSSLDNSQSIPLSLLNSPAPVSAIYSPDLNFMHRMLPRGRNFSFSLSPGLHAAHSPAMMPVTMNLSDIHSSPTLLPMSAARTNQIPQYQPNLTASITPRAHEAAASLMQAASMQANANNNNKNNIHNGANSRQQYYQQPNSIYQTQHFSDSSNNMNSNKRRLDEEPISSIDVSNLKRVKLEQVKSNNYNSNQNIVYSLHSSFSLPTSSSSSLSSPSLPSLNLDITNSNDSLTNTPHLTPLFPSVSGD